MCFCFTVWSCECIFLCVVLSDVYWHVPYSAAFDAETTSVELIVCVYVSDIPVISRPVSFVEFSTNLLEGSCRYGWVFYFIYIFFFGGGGEDTIYKHKKCNSNTVGVLAAKTAPELQVTETRKQWDNSAAVIRGSSRKQLRFRGIWVQRLLYNITIFVM